MDKDIPYILKECGLDDKEITLYLYLVRNKRLTAYKIAKDTRIHRSNCYNILERLIKKGFVMFESDGNNRLYYASELDNVLGKIKNTESLILSLIPKIKSLSSKENTSVRYADSKGSFAQFDTKLFRLAKEKKITFGYMISNSPNLTTMSSRILIERLLNDLASSKSLQSIDCKAIWDEDFRNTKFMQQFAKLGKNKFINSLQNKVTTFIYDEHIAFVFLDDEERFIEIESKAVSEEMKSYFLHLWQIAKE